MPIIHIKLLTNKTLVTVGERIPMLMFMPVYRNYIRGGVTVAVALTIPLGSTH